MTTMGRRGFIAGLMGSVACPALALDGQFPVQRSEADWRALLTPAQYRVMREHGTERSGSSPLHLHSAPGTYHCRGCDTALYSSQTKFHSSSGWPSFWGAIPGSIGTSRDTRGMMVRTEVHCATCGSHLGHIFADGPQPTGHRHCLNGVCLMFRAA